MVKEVECTEKVIDELMMEIAQLREERDYYKINYELLHNKENNTNEVSDEKEYYDNKIASGEISLDGYAQGLAEWGYSYEADIEESI